MPHIEDNIIYHQDSGDILVPVKLNEDGTLIRESDPLQMGKRYFCGLFVDVPGEDKKVDRKPLTGNQITASGRSVYVGCGCELLGTKVSKEAVDRIVTCCDMDLTVVKPVPLPSSD
ncbi:MAG: hypothetical protein WCV81_03395 [Microgenomates group bacterium]|jgi:hypothetical protein